MNLVLKLPRKKIRGIYLQLILVLVMFWLRDILNFPSSITYLTDVLLVFLLVKEYRNIFSNIKNSNSKVQNIIFSLILINMFLGATVNLVNPILFLWGMRNNLRFYLFFFLCIGVLRKKDVDLFIKILKKFYWINFFLCLYQYFILGLSNDYLGGIFGITQGCNAYINIFLCMILAIILGEYFTKKVTTFKFLLYIVTSILIATFCELKIFYIEFIIMFLLVILNSKISLKTIFICGIGIFGICIGVFFMLSYNPEIFNLFLNRDSLNYYLNGKGYTNSGDLNRFTAIQEIYKQFFKGNIKLSLFGFGLGSCEHSSFKFLESDFYIKYSYLNYRWMTHAWVYLEQGIIGILLLLLFYIKIFNFNIMRKKIIPVYLYIAVLTYVPICILGLIYNCALQLEASYLLAFMCSIPYVMVKEKNLEVKYVKKNNKKINLQRKV